ncbi:HAMP domain-containing protein [Spirulina subsalsa FACHB-351]|uniref:HAMP domain-containing protein n=1 Tax=Spirulina subsalsa FACHB-351 TaxID=234711 RepID=A0ABT3L683_9CYAN|nr:HAMP domain-containing protein [Spirulina subsalsa FACHB-351]
MIVTRLLGLKRLRSTLIIPFVLQLTAAIGLVSYIYFQSSQKVVHDLSSQLRNELTARIEGELQSYFTSPHNINQLNAAAFIEGDLDFQQAKNVHQMLQQFQFTPFLFSIYCGTEQGEFLGVGTKEPGGQVYLQTLSSQTNYRFHYYNLDSQGNRLSFVADDGPYDPRQRPWYKAALKAQKPTWSEIYLDFGTLLPTITAVRPVYDSQGNSLGVCATDVSTPTEFRHFLANLHIGKTGQAFVIDQDGQIISSSTDEPLTVGQGDKAHLILAVESHDPLIRDTARFIQEKFGHFSQIQRSQDLNFRSNNQQYFVQILPFQDPYGLDWLIVVTIPEADFMAQIYADHYYALTLMVIALGLAIALGILTAQRITRPILRLTAASQAIASGQLEQHIPPSSIVELNILDQSFNTMAAQLNDTFNQVKLREKEREDLIIAYSRFIPQDHLSLLNRESITNIHLGDHVEREMSVLFSDIRDFTRLSEQMTPEDNFQFINDYLSWMNPAILENNGFIDKYIGDGIMALFAHSPDDAVKAGIGLLERLVQYNQRRVT